MHIQDLGDNNDEYITAEARQYAKQYGLTKGTPEYDAYLKTYLKTYKKYPYNQDKRLRQLQKHEARNRAIDAAKISSDNAQIRQKGLIPYILNSCLFWVILILAILVIITILFPEYVLMGIGIIIAFAVFSFLMKWFFGI